MRNAEAETNLPAAYNFSFRSCTFVAMYVFKILLVLGWVGKVLLEKRMGGKVLDSGGG